MLTSLFANIDFRQSASLNRDVNLAELIWERTAPQILGQDDWRCRELQKISKSDLILEHLLMKCPRKSEFHPQNHQKTCTGGLLDDFNLFWSKSTINLWIQELLVCLKPDNRNVDLSVDLLRILDSQEDGSWNTAILSRIDRTSCDPLNIMSSKESQERRNNPLLAQLTSWFQWEPWT